MTEDKVQEQYKEYPYPTRNPEDEKKRLVLVPLASTKLINSLFWGGKKTFDKNFRILDAGCGTGDSVISLGEQLKETEVEITGLDFSNASLEIAKKRAEVRELKNIKFIQDSILNIPKLNLGKFDYIICTGVLHHLENPNEGLKILADSLKEDGGMAIMLYAKYGRTAVYMLQDLLRRINKDETNTKKKIENAREVLRNLPNYHWWKFAGKIIHREVTVSDSQLYDLLLHPRDKPYTIPEIYELAESSNLKILKFEDNGLYEPTLYLKGGIAKDIEKLPKNEKEAIAELLNSKIIKHIFFSVRKNYVPPEVTPDNQSIIPIYNMDNKDIEKLLKDINDGREKIIIRKSNFVAQFSINKKNIAILSLIDGRRSIKEILEEVTRQTEISYEELFEEWKKVYTIIKDTNLIVLNLP